MENESLIPCAYFKPTIPWPFHLKAALFSLFRTWFTHRTWICHHSVLPSLSQARLKPVNTMTATIPCTYYYKFEQHILRSMIIVLLLRPRNQSLSVWDVTQACSVMRTSCPMVGHVGEAAGPLGSCLRHYSFGPVHNDYGQAQQWCWCHGQQGVLAFYMESGSKLTRTIDDNSGLTTTSWEHGQRQLQQE